MTIFVYVDLEGEPQLVGRLWSRFRNERESATFEYDPAWLGNPNRYSLEPGLHLGAGPQHTVANQPLFGALGDSAPDRWGRNLMRHGERRRVKKKEASRGRWERSTIYCWSMMKPDKGHSASRVRQAVRFWLKRVNREFRR